jgi:hypothetical protein
MKRNVPIEKTFDVIRRLPPEIDLDAVRLFIIQHPVIPPAHQFNWINLKNFFTMTVITSIVTVALIFTRPSHEASNDIPKIIKENIAPAAEPNEVVPNEVKQEISPASNTLKKEPANDIAPLDKKNIALLPEEEENLTPVVPLEICPNSVIVPDSTCTIAIATSRVRTASSCKCHCSFGDDNDWIDAVVQELMHEKLITDECEYRFKITGSTVWVNGKELKDTSYTEKLIGIYKSAGGERLEKYSYEKVEADHENCGLSKNINH